MGPLAQLVEQLAFNQLVEGSNPSRPTTFSPRVIFIRTLLSYPYLHYYAVSLCGIAAKYVW